LGGGEGECSKRKLLSQGCAIAGNSTVKVNMLSFFMSVIFVDG
jgi:hypothetical protein